uniref:Uncharacterized protein n=1 Tax=Cebus imitator TaxID=2715852 RepID=A0A2K5PY00_CEBIM
IRGAGLGPHWKLSKGIMCSFENEGKLRLRLLSNRCRIKHIGQTKDHKVCTWDHWNILSLLLYWLEGTLLEKLGLFSFSD